MTFAVSSLDLCSPFDTWLNLNWRLGGEEKFTHPITSKVEINQPESPAESAAQAAQPGIKM